MNNRARLVEELKMLMQTSFNGLGWVRMKEILAELGIDPQTPAQKLVKKLEEITNQKLGGAE